MYVSASELQQIEGIQDALLHPLEIEPVGKWLNHLVDGFRALTGAVHSLFILYDLGEIVFHSDDLAPEALDAYKKTASVDQNQVGLDVSEQLMHVIHQWRSSLGTHVATRDDLRKQQPTLVLEDFEFFNEVIVPAGMAYPVMMGTSSYRGVASLDIFGVPADHAFQERAAFFMNRLLPAFVSGMNGHLSISACKQTLFSVFDVLPEAIVVFNEDGKIVYANPMYANYEKEEPGPSLLQLAIKDFVRGRLGTAIRSKTRADQWMLLPTSQFKSEMAAYKMESFYLPSKTLGDSYLAVRLMRKVALITPSLAARFRLSPRECEVVELLVEGYSNKEIAIRLFISVHTVRRHVEAILKKLNARSRASVMFTLFRET